MKSFVYLLGSVCAVAAYLVIRDRQAAVSQSAAAAAPVEDLAHRLQDAWADHHTVA